jgi:hypothetical protein
VYGYWRLVGWDGMGRHCGVLGVIVGLCSVY